MAKYIDAEKLIAEIERRLFFDNNWIEGDKKRQMHTSGVSSAYYKIIGSKHTCESILDFITSLQQEQPFPRWIHANYSDKPEIRQSPSGGPYLQSGPYMIWLSDLETLPKDGTDLTNPIQEQPEMDLEEETKRWWKEHLHLNPENKLWMDAHQSVVFARHFFDLGRNARKEE